jgi:hypothetical protein
MRTVDYRDARWRSTEVIVGFARLGIASAASNGTAGAERVRG